MVFLSYLLSIFRLAKSFYKKIHSNQMHIQMLAMMLLMCLEMMIVFDWPGLIQLFSTFDTPWIWFDHSVDVVFTFEGIHTFGILLKLFYVPVLSFLVHLYFSDDIFWSNPCLTEICLIVVYASSNRRSKSFST